MKKALKISYLFIGVFAIIYSLKNDYKYIFTLLSAVICFSIIPFIILLKRNLKISKTLFNTRFLWLYTLIILLSIFLFSTLKFLMRGENLSKTGILIILGLSLLIGIIWGFIEFLKVKNKKDGNELFESLDLVNNNQDTEMSGILTLTKTNEVSFYEKNVEVYKIKTSEIKNVVVHTEYKLFPTHFLIALENGKTFRFNSEFPYVWKSEIQKH